MVVFVASVFDLLVGWFCELFIWVCGFGASALGMVSDGAGHFPFFHFMHACVDECCDIKLSSALF